MSKYIHLEDNGDGTITATTNFSGEIETILMPVDFNALLRGFAVDPDLYAKAKGVVGEGVVIPDNVGNLD